MAIVNLAKTSNEDRELVEQGPYMVKVLGEDIKDNRIQWKLEIVEGDFKGRWLFYSAPLEGKGSFFMKKFIRAVMNNPDLNTDRFDTASMIGKHAMVLVEHQDYNGKTYAKVMEVDPVDEDNIPL